MAKMPRERRGVAWLAAKAAKNPEFREQLLADPKTTVERELGIALEDDVTVRVVEDTPTTRYVVLPLKPTLPSGTHLGGELSDTELLGLLRGENGPIGTSFCPNENDNI